MSINSRTKGAAGERELIREIEEWTGIRLERNLAQSFAGGHDLIGLDHWAIECKRYRSISEADKRAFWAQAVRQAARVDKMPAVAFRQDRQPWRVLIVYPAQSELYPLEDYRAPCEIELELFCALIRESL
jgi:Holliday junction resolvase